MLHRISYVEKFYKKQELPPTLLKRLKTMPFITVLLGLTLFVKPMTEDNKKKEGKSRKQAATYY